MSDVPDMKLRGPDDDEETGLSFKKRYGDDVVDPETGLRYDTKYEPNTTDSATGLDYTKKYEPEVNPGDPGPKPTKEQLDKSNIIADQNAGKYGPPAPSPFDDFDKEQLAKFDKALKIADGVKLYHSAGGAGVASQWKPYAEQMARAGGLTEETALALARYRMWKAGQAVPNERLPDLTDEQKEARRQEFIAGDARTRARLMQEDEQANFNAQQGFYDSLVQKKQSKPVAKKPQFGKAE